MVRTMLPRWLLIGGFVLAGRAHGSAAPQPAVGAVPFAVLNRASKDSLSRSLRIILLQALPDPLYEKSSGWGHKARFGKTEKKQGVWRKIRVTALNPNESFQVELRDIQVPEAGHYIFTIFLAIDARVDYQRQIWEAGLKLLEGSVRARTRLNLTLRSEATVRIDAAATPLPDAVITVRATRAELTLKNAVVEHIAGVGGDAAKRIGDALQLALHRLTPTLEKDLLKRADAAIVKAGHEREIRLGLATFLKKQASFTKARTAPK